jgi:hypothetical protein
MKTFSFQTKDNFRIDVKATTPNSAYNKLKSIPNYANLITEYYYQYDNDGYYNFSLGWKKLEKQKRKDNKCI